VAWKKKQWRDSRAGCVAGLEVNDYGHDGCEEELLVRTMMRLVGFERDMVVSSWSSAG